VADPPAAEKLSVTVPEQQQETGQPFRTAIVNSQVLNNMLRAVTVVQQIMTQFNGTVSEEDKIVALTRIVLNLMKQNGQ
jgi:hypothetical protein